MRCGRSPRRCISKSEPRGTGADLRDRAHRDFDGARPEGPGMGNPRLGSRSGSARRGRSGGSGVGDRGTGRGRADAGGSRRARRSPLGGSRHIAGARHTRARDRRGFGEGADRGARPDRPVRRYPPDGRTRGHGAGRRTTRVVPGRHVGRCARRGERDRSRDRRIDHPRSRGETRSHGGGGTRRGGRSDQPPPADRGGRAPRRCRGDRRCDGSGRRKLPRPDPRRGVGSVDLDGHPDDESRRGRRGRRATSRTAGLPHDLRRRTGPDPRGGPPVEGEPHPRPRGRAGRPRGSARGDRHRRPGSRRAKRRSALRSRRPGSAQPLQQSNQAEGTHGDSVSDGRFVEIERRRVEIDGRPVAADAEPDQRPRCVLEEP